MMVTGENTKYHEAAQGLKGLRAAADPFNDVQDPNKLAFALDADTISRLTLHAINGGAVGGVNLFDPKAAEEVAAKKREKEAEQRLQDAVMLQRIRELNRQIAWHNKEIERLTDEIGVLERYAERLERGDEIELNEDGSVKDPAVEAAIRSYEKANGVKVDRNDPAAIRSVIETKREEREGHKRDVITKTAERDADLARVKRSTVPETVRAVEEIEREQGHNEADAVVSQLNREQKTAVVGSQHFDEETERNAHAVASNGSDALFGASNRDDTQIGSWKSGDVTGHFAMAAAAPPENAQPEPASPSVEDKPFSFTQSMNG